MSFNRKGNENSERKPVERNTEEDIKRVLRGFQDNIRQIDDQLGRVARGAPPRGAVEKMRDLMQRSEQGCTQLEDLFKVWTNELNASPQERHLKKFSLDKLRRVFEDEKKSMSGLQNRVAKVESDVEALAKEEEKKQAEAARVMEEGEGEELLPKNDEHAKATIAVQEHVAEERMEGMKRIQNQVHEINDIMRDLGAMVVEQGQAIDTIENNVDQTKEQTTAAVDEIRKADEKDRARGSRTCYLLMFVVLMVCSLLGFYNQAAIPNLIEKVKHVKVRFNHLGGSIANATVAGTNYTMSEVVTHTPEAIRVKTVRASLENVLQQD